MMPTPVKENYTVLLVDDDDSFRHVTKQVLENRGLVVYDASNGKEAESMLGMIHVDLILTDVRMPLVHGIELLHYVKGRYPDLPVLVMTGFADMIDHKGAIDVGASGFLNKPFSLTELVDAVNVILTPKENDAELEESIDMSAYCRQHLKNFRSDMQIDCPIFLKISENKLVKIANTSHDLNSEMLDKLYSRGIHYLYILSDDYKHFLENNTQLSSIIVATDEIDLGDKAHIYKKNLRHLLKMGANEKLDLEVVEMLKKNIEMVVDLFCDDKRQFNVYEQLNDPETDLSVHSFHVSLVATSIAKTMGWTSRQKLFIVSAAGLLHDIGLFAIDPDLWNKPYTAMSGDERKRYEEHPSESARIVARLKDFPPGLGQIILQHHEFADGSGFPLGLGRFNTHSVAKMVGLADLFCHRYHSQLEAGEKLSPKQVYRRMEANKHQLDDEFLGALQQSINEEAKPKKMTNLANKRRIS